MDNLGHTDGVSQIEVLLGHAADVNLRVDPQAIDDRADIKDSV
jgi:hypothetical protein